MIEDPTGVPPDATESGSRQTVRGGDPPPFLGSWRKIYLLVVIELAVTVALFALLAGWAS